jgi:uncharacterized protein involved in tolerance to divalent cations
VPWWTSDWPLVSTWCRVWSPSIAGRVLLIKTSSGRLEALRERLVALHPYQLPELIALRIEDGWPPYLAWIAHSLEHDG